MRLARAVLGLLLLQLATWLYATATALLEGSHCPPALPWRSALLAGVAAGRVLGVGHAL